MTWKCKLIEQCLNHIKLLMQKSLKFLHFKFKAEHNNKLFNMRDSRDECQSNPCQHSGICKDKFNGYECICQDGYFGKDCSSNYDDCASMPCKNAGKNLHLNL